MNPNQTDDEHMVSVIEGSNSTNMNSFTRFGRIFESNGITQSDINSSISVLKLISEASGADEESPSNSSGNSAQSFQGIKELLKVIQKIQTKKGNSTESNSIGVKDIYCKLQLLPRNVYFATKNKRSDNPSSSKHPSLFEALLEHINIPRKQLNLQLKIMRMSKNRFPLLAFTPSRRGLMLIKNHVDDVPPRLNPKFMDIEPNEVNAFYEKMKMLPRNTYFAIRPKVEPNFLDALNSIIPDETPDVNEEDYEVIELNEKRSNKMNQRDLRIMIEITKNSPQLFPLLHYHGFRFNGSPWLMVKSDPNIFIVGGPNEENQGKAIVVDSKEEANEILEERSRSFYTDIVLELNTDEKYSNGRDGMFYRACKEIEPNLTNYRLRNFLLYYKKNKDKFLRLKNVEWNENEESIRGFVLVSEDASKERLPDEIDGQLDMEMMEDEISPSNDTKMRGGQGRALRMKLKRQNLLHHTIDKLTEKLEALNNSDRKGAKIQIRKRTIENRRKKLKENLQQFSDDNNATIANCIDEAEGDTK